MQVSRSGQIRRPCSQMSSPTLTTAVISSPPRQQRAEPEQEAGAADPPDQHRHRDRRSSSQCAPETVRRAAAPPGNGRIGPGIGSTAREPRSTRAVVARGEPRAEARAAEPGRLDVPHRALPLGRVRGEHLEHPGVVERPAEQRPADHGGDVEVADAHRVRVAPGALGDLGRGPHPDARAPGAAAPGPRSPPSSTALSSRWATAARPGSPGAGRESTPARCHSQSGTPADCGGRRRHPHPVGRRAGGGLAEAAAQLAPGPPRLGAGDLLLQHRRDQHVPHPPGGAEPQSPACAGAASATSGWWATNARVVVRRPSSAGRPSSDHAAPGPQAVQTTVPSARRQSRRSSRGRRASCRRARRAARPVDAQRRVAPAAAQRAEHAGRSTA